MDRTLAPVDSRTFMRMVRFALRSGADQLHFRPGFRPLLDGIGGARTLRFRQLTGEDTEAVAGHLLERAWVPSRLQGQRTDGALGSRWWAELSGEALLDVGVFRDRGGLQLSLYLIRPISEGDCVEIYES